MTESLIDLCDGIRPLLVAAVAGATGDDTCERPYEHDAGVVYLYPAGPDVHEPDGLAHDIERFALNADYVLATSERATKQAQRAISVSLDAAAHAIAATVRANRVDPVDGRHLWKWLAATVLHNDIRTLRTRGFRVQITGWRTVGP